MGNRIYGCDDCLAVCPWNSFAGVAREAEFAARADIGERPLSQLLALDDAAFRELFARTPVKRTGRDRFLRNVLIAAGNSADASLVGPVRRLLDDPHPLVRGAAVWALSRLDAMALAAERPRHAREPDPDVIAEWNEAMT
jgi:epoxyqueuosine reductase